MSRLAPSFLPPLVLDSSCGIPLYRQIEIWFRRATVYPLSECYVRPPRRGGLIIGYANLDVSAIPAILNALNTGICEATQALRARSAWEWS